jgi:hypothetical protein
MGKQTAVEFLIKEFSEILGPLETKPMQDLLLVDAIKRAKQMDMEQKRNMFDCGRKYQLTGEGPFKEVYEEMYVIEDVIGDVKGKQKSETRIFITNIK